jgi:hypothetical protein
MQANQERPQEKLQQKPIVLTGDRPTGGLHLGHYIGTLKSRVALQRTHWQYVLIADAQGLTDNASDPGRIRRNILEVALDYLAVGIDPTETTICVQDCRGDKARGTDPEHWVRRAAIKAYNEWHWDGDGAAEDAPAEFLERITVNFIRHNLTAYDRALEEVAGRVGIASAAQAIRARIYSAIGESSRVPSSLSFF